MMWSSTRGNLTNLNTIIPSAVLHRHHSRPPKRTHRLAKELGGSLYQSNLPGVLWPGQPAGAISAITLTSSSLSSATGTQNPSVHSVFVCGSDSKTWEQVLLSLAISDKALCLMASVCVCADLLVSFGIRCPDTGSVVPKWPCNHSWLPLLLWHSAVHTHRHTRKGTHTQTEIFILLWESD